MSIRFKCAECGSSMKIKDELAGTKGKCPKCKTEFTVPEPVEQEAAVVAAAAEAKSEVVEDPEDEFQRILMGGDSPGNTPARRQEIDSDDFINSTGVEESAKAAAPSTAEIAATETPPPIAKARSSAEISAMLMKSKSEPTLKKTGKAFGDATNDKDAALAKRRAEMRAYYSRQIFAGGGAVVVVCLGLYWLMSSMMTGTKYPPLGRVSGKVTYNGQPVVGGAVSFQPMREGLDDSSKGGGSAGVTDRNGSYTLYYVEGVPGAVVGKHSVQVRAQGENGLEMIPPNYNDTTQLVLEVKSGSNTHDITIPGG